MSSEIPLWRDTLFSARSIVLAFSTALLLAACARNEPPSISVGDNLDAISGQRVALAAEASDPDGSVVEYRWEQTAGKPVSLIAPHRRIGEFVAPVVDGHTTLRFRLTVTDDGNSTASDEIAVTVAPYGSLRVALSGAVRSHATHAPVGGASVTVSQYRGGTSYFVGGAVSDGDGTYAVEVPASPGRLTVHAEAAGFAAQSAVVTLPGETGSRTVHVNLVPVQATREFGTAEGADVGIDGQTIVSLPPDALTSENGEAYSGRAVASVAVLDPSRDPSVMPGDFQAWDAESQTSAPIESYGAVNVALHSDSGARLQLSGAGLAQLSIPLASGRPPQNAPPAMPLYYWSEEQGYWIEEGAARLAEVSPGVWAYVGTVGHFSTWNADRIYESVTVSGCVADGNGNPIGYAQLKSRGIDYTGTSSATAGKEGRFEIAVRSNSEVELMAASDDESSDSMTISTGEVDLSLEECLVVTGERGLSDFPVQIEGESGTIDICVRDHECEDGDAVSVDVEGRNVFTGEIVNDARCSTLDVEAGRDYVIELTALNGTGFKGACNFADANTGEIVVRGLDVQTQVWRHRQGAGSQARIVVTTGIPQPFTIVPTPADATVRLLGTAGRDYEPGMELVAGEYRVEVSSPGYKTWEVTVTHGSEGPTRFAVNLERIYEPGDVFTEPLSSGGEGPEMVVIPAGAFRMGCLSNDDDCRDDEQPVHEVTLALPLALSVYEVTFAEWDACVAAGGCGGHEPDDEGWGRGSRPVIDMSWDDARAYAEWLSAQTGAEYRLPSEAEWEYAARAGTATKYSWGNEIGVHCANCYGCGGEWAGALTAPVGSFQSNAFGLYDMHGNVWEWVADCWNGSYAGAPSDGSVWLQGDCDRRVLRGGYWGYIPRGLRAAYRFRNASVYRDHDTGFRVARTLTR